MKEDALAVFRRRKIGFVFQAFNLVSSINVWENIVLPLGLDGRKVDEAYVNDIIATLGIEKRIYNLPNQLSGGQDVYKRQAIKYGELVFDVNSAYFYNHGGYEFAKQMCIRDRVCSR